MNLSAFNVFAITLLAVFHYGQSLIFILMYDKIKKN